MKISFSTQNGISVKYLAELCGGRLFTEAECERLLRGICTDSREADADTVFVAMRGERVDGHDYIDAALQNGCRCVICEHFDGETSASEVSFIVVGDSELSLAKIAEGYRKAFSYSAVAVTGSVGKTTAKEMIAEVLATQKEVYRSKGNYNSVIGMPLSVMEIDHKTEVAVLEMGMSGFGEIERMSLAAAPQIAVITNIGTSHMEMLGSRENICRAKLEVLAGLVDGGLLILNGDEPLLNGIGGRRYHTVYASIERRDTELFAQNIRVDVDSTTFDIVYRGSVWRDMKLCVAGRHNVYAALYAFAVGMQMGISVEHIRTGLLNFSTVGMRQNRYAWGELTLIEDCYNASPESMIAALDVLEASVRKTGGRAVAVLGDMLELGAQSPALHAKVGQYLANKQVSQLVTVGIGALDIADGAIRSGMSQDCVCSITDREDAERIGSELVSRLRKGDTVLFKASRSVRLERIVAYVKEHFTNI